jgi:hypothetical protein
VRVVFLQKEGDLRHITEGNVPVLAVASMLALPVGSVVVFDRSYADYRSFGDWTAGGCRSSRA